MNEKENKAFWISIANIFVTILQNLTGQAFLIILSLVLCMLALEKVNSLKKQGLGIHGKVRAAQIISYIILVLNLLVFIMMIL